MQQANGNPTKNAKSVDIYNVLIRNVPQTFTYMTIETTLDWLHQISNEYQAANTMEELRTNGTNSPISGLAFLNIIKAAVPIL